MEDIKRYKHVTKVGIIIIIILPDELKQEHTGYWGYKEI